MEVFLLSFEFFSVGKYSVTGFPECILLLFVRYTFFGFGVEYSFTLTVFYFEFHQGLLPVV